MSDSISTNGGWQAGSQAPFAVFPLRHSQPRSKSIASLRDSERARDQPPRPKSTFAQVSMGAAKLRASSDARHPTLDARPRVDPRRIERAFWILLRGDLTRAKSRRPNASRCRRHARHPQAFVAHSISARNRDGARSKRLAPRLATPCRNDLQPRGICRIAKAVRLIGKSRL